MEVEILILLCSLVLFFISIILVTTTNKIDNTQKKQLWQGNQKVILNKRNPVKHSKSSDINVLNISKDIKDNIPIGIIVYRIPQEFESDLYNKRGEIIKRRFPPG